MVEISSFPKSMLTLSLVEFGSLERALLMSVIIHRSTRPNSTPINGGKLNRLCRTGTIPNESMPIMRRVLWNRGVIYSGRVFFIVVGLSEIVSPFLNIYVVMAKGTHIIVKAEGSTWEIWWVALRFPPVHSRSVVTSPIGDQEPPAFAAIIVVHA